MEVEDLTPGYKIYDVEIPEIKWFSYLCIHPTNKKYHILVDRNEDPVKIYHQHLQKILNKNLTSYEKANKYLIRKLEEKIKTLKKEE